MRVDLPFRPPLALAPLRRLLVAHAVPGLERYDAAADTLTKVVRAPHGPALVTVALSGDAGAAAKSTGAGGSTGADGSTNTATADRLRVELRLADPADAARVLGAVRRWLDLDADPAAVGAVLSQDARLAPMVARRPGLRVLGSTDPFETAMSTVLGQQVSLAAARTFAGRLVGAFGEPVGADGEFRSFPTPAALGSVDPAELQRAVGVTHARARTLLTLAVAVANGLPLAGLSQAAGGAARRDPDPRDTVRRDLLALPGIGPWTADYLAVRLGDPDAFPADDLVLRRALGVRTAREATALAAPWRPYRAYGLFHVWVEAYFS